MQAFERPVVPEVKSSIARSPSAFGGATGRAGAAVAQHVERAGPRARKRPRARRRRRRGRARAAGGRGRRATSATAAASAASSTSSSRAAQVEHVREHATAERRVDRGEHRARAGRRRTAAAPPPGSWAAAWRPCAPAARRAGPARGRAPSPRASASAKLRSPSRRRRNARPAWVARALGQPRVERRDRQRRLPNASSRSRTAGAAKPRTTASRSALEHGRPRCAGRR